MKDHKELQVWQKSMELVEEVYRLVRVLPRQEQYALSDQLRRAVVSIPSNIAEGNVRESEKEFFRFLSIAQGSNAEVETQLLICRRLGFFNDDQVSAALDLQMEVSKMLRALIKKLSANS